MDHGDRGVEEAEQDRVPITAKNIDPQERPTASTNTSSDAFSPSQTALPSLSSDASASPLLPLSQRLSRQPPVASPLRSAIRTPTGSADWTEPALAGSPSSGNHTLPPDRLSMSDFLSRPTAGMQRTRSHMDQSSGEGSSGSGSGTVTPTSTLPLQGSPSQRTSAAEQRRHSDTDHLAVHMSTHLPPPRWAGPVQTTVQQQSDGLEARSEVAGAALVGSHYGSSSGAPTLGTGGYTSSVDADYYSLPPSRLVSRTPTPVLPAHQATASSVVTSVGGAHSSSPDFILSTTDDSEEEDSDVAAVGPRWKGPKDVASLFGFGKKTNKYRRLGGKDYHAMETRKGQRWADEPDTPVMESQSGFRGKDRGKAFDVSAATAPSSDGLLDQRRSRSHRRRKQAQSKVPWPFRVVSSLLFKTFRTFFGPIHPLTIMVALVLIAGFVTSVTMLIIYILNPDKEPLPWRTYCQQQMPFPHAYAEALAPVSVLVGVLTVDSKYERRNMIRQTYARHTLPVDSHGNPTSNVQVKFVLGKVRKSHARRVALEMEAFNDIVVLDMEETQSARKTLGFMKWAAENATVPFLRPVGPDWSNMSTVVPNPTSAGGLTGWEPSKSAEAIRDEQRYQLGWKKVDYVVKADDDSYIVLDELERHLRVAPRKMTYWGYLIKNWFMGGEAYALSSDLVEWMANSPDLAKSAKGKEDTRTPQWIALHPNRSSINWVSEHCWIYDHPKGGSPYSHGFLFPDYVEKIKLEARRGLSEQEIAYRGGERASQAYSTVTRWHQKYLAPRKDLTVEEEVEALIEGGGRWAGTWVRNGDGKEGESWIPYEEIVYTSDDDRLTPSSTNLRGSSVLADDVGWEPSSGLPIYGRVNSAGKGTGVAAEEAVGTKASVQGRNLLSDLTNLPNHLLSDDGEGGRHQTRQSGYDQPSGRHPLHRHLLPRPSHKDGDGEYAALRARRYLNRPHGGTVVVHYLKKTEQWLETALALSGKPKMWTNGAGGRGKEWRMGGSPLVRGDGYILQGRSQPRPMDASIAPAEDPYTAVPESASRVVAQDSNQQTGTATHKHIDARTARTEKDRQ